MTFSCKTLADFAPRVHEPGLDRPRGYVERDGDFRHAHAFEVEQRECGTLLRRQFGQGCDHTRHVAGEFGGLVIRHGRLGPLAGRFRLEHTATQGALAVPQIVEAIGVLDRDPGLAAKATTVGTPICSSTISGTPGMEAQPPASTMPMP